MIVSLLTGRKNSKGFPNKHFCKLGDNVLSYYPMEAAVKCREIDKRYISTDDDKLIDMAINFNIEVINRPSYLATDEALSEDVFVHALDIIKERNPNETIDIVVLLMCNAPCITYKTLSRGIKILRNNPDIDSAITVSKYNMWSPIRARKIGEDGLLHPFVLFDKFDNMDDFNCDRDSQGDCWFADMGASIVKTRCIENIKSGLLPQKWMGHKIYPLQQKLGLDVDYVWQVHQMKDWLKLYGKKL